MGLALSLIKILDQKCMKHRFEMEALRLILKPSSNLFK